MTGCSPIKQKRLNLWLHTNRENTLQGVGNSRELQNTNVQASWTALNKALYFNTYPTQSHLHLHLHRMFWPLFTAEELPLIGII
jgi:hypothetical protein